MGHPCGRVTVYSFKSKTWQQPQQHRWELISFHISRYLWRYTKKPSQQCNILMRFVMTSKNLFRKLAWIDCSGFSNPYCSIRMDAFGDDFQLRLSCPLGTVTCPESVQDDPSMMKSLSNQPIEVEKSGVNCDQNCQMAVFFE